MKNTPGEKCAAIMAHYGVKHQLVKLCKECGELIAEACKAESMNGFLHEDFIKELADVSIMTEQFRLIIEQEKAAREIFESTVSYKLDRQMERIKSE